MAVVDHDRGPLEIEQVEPAGRSARPAGEAFEAQPDEFQRHAKPPGRRGAGQHVVYLEVDQAAVHQRHAIEMGEPGLPRAVTQHDPTLAHGGREAPLREMLDEHGVGRVEGEIDHLPLAPFLHAHDQGIGGIEHGGAAGPHRRDDRPLHPGDLFGRVDLGDAEVIPRGDVGDDRDVAAVEAAALPEDAPPRCLEHRRGDRGVGKHPAGALRAAAVAGIDLPATDPNPLRAGVAHGGATGGGKMGDQPHDRGLAVRASDRSRRNPTVVARAEQGVDDSGTDIPRHAHRWLEVHPQPGGRVDLDHDAPLRLERLRDVLHHQVDARDIEADDPRRLDGPRRDVGMHDVGDVFRRAPGAQVGIPPQEYRPARRGHVLLREPLLPKHGRRHLVDHHRAQRGGMIAAPPRILVDPVDQLPHRRRAVADDRRRMPPRGGHHPVADDEHPVVGSGHEPLDDDRRILLSGEVPGLLDLLTGDEVYRDTPSLVAVPRLDDDRTADLLGHRPGVGCVGDRPPLGNRDA